MIGGKLEQGSTAPPDLVNHTGVQSTSIYNSKNSTAAFRSTMASHIRVWPEYRSQKNQPNQERNLRRAN